MIKRLLVCLSCLLFSSYIFASVHLELTQGVAAKRPVAVESFEGEAAYQNDGTVTDIVRNDLTISGRFKVKRGLSSDMPLLTGTISQGIDGRLQASVLLTEGSGEAKTTFLEKKYHANPSQVRQLAHHISDDIYKSLTGDQGVFSTKIAYVLAEKLSRHRTRYRLEVADMDGFNPQPLLMTYEPIMSPTWSPDGRQIAYASLENRHAQIFIEDLASGDRHSVISIPGINGAPAWSPDGKKLAIVLSKGQNPDIYILDIRTHRLKQITSHWAIDTEPRWSADGRSIVFTSDRGGTPQIYQYFFADGRTVRLTFQGNYNARGSLSPDGKELAVLHRNQGPFSIALDDLNTGFIHVLVESALGESPSLAPNGKMIIYATQENNRGVLRVVSTDGHVKLRLPAPDGDVREPAWGPLL